jgi:hypothetical protein
MWSAVTCPELFSLDLEASMRVQDVMTEGAKTIPPPVSPGM